MEDVKLITCIVQRGKADKAVKAAMEAGAEGATIFYARGTGVRQKLGILGKLIEAEKEVIMIVARRGQHDAVFDALTKASELDKPGKGFAFVHTIERAVGFLDESN
jgi:nitrogen regulatory protein P-II 1